ncbi:TetR family transcriptional regulator [Actinocorallia populi]|uniref:TetR family transcriptional regulator n=1 Tax=Actinocorallia populi TaxID=2079200 RepID=UPI000D08ADA3|nr:TetR family transcriptional regulator [Actinocorallia populi]
MPRTKGTGSDLRQRTRRAVRAELAELAMAMFVERGYDQTTVDDIAAAAGLSKRSFFRYFPAKEDVVFDEVEEVADRVAADIRARSGDEPAWDCLHAVLRRWNGEILDARRELTGLRLIESSPALRARLHHRRDELRVRVGEALLQREGSELDVFTADLLTAAAGAALDAADRAWLRSDGTADRGELVDRAFALLAPQRSRDRPGT